MTSIWLISQLSTKGFVTALGAVLAAQARLNQAVQLSMRTTWACAATAYKKANASHSAERELLFAPDRTHRILLSLRLLLINFFLILLMKPVDNSDRFRESVGLVVASCSVWIKLYLLTISVFINTIYTLFHSFEINSLSLS